MQRSFILNEFENAFVFVSVDIHQTEYGIRIQRAHIALCWQKSKIIPKPKEVLIDSTERIQKGIF